MFESFAFILSVSALLSYLNHKFLKLPVTIGLMVLALFTAGIFIITESFSPKAYAFFTQIVLDIDFKTVLMDVMLSFLLFAGAMHVNIKDLSHETKPVFLFTTLGVLISTVVIGGLVYSASLFIGLEIPFIYTLLFGALISPTDPIAVLSILEASNVSKSLKLKIEGESLFNDGVGVVVFITILEISKTMEGGAIDLLGIGTLFAREAIGGIMYGLALGYLGWVLFKSIYDEPKICVLITLAIATGGYSLASIIHVSGPLAMVVSGLFIGNKIREKGFLEKSEHFLTTIWEMLDDVLNSVLFVLIGLVILSLEFNTAYFVLGLLSIVIVLVARYVSIGLPYSLLKHTEHSPQKTIMMLTWGGLRGGISVALALSISEEVVYKDAILFITYCVVLFSIIVQGLSIKKVFKKLKIV